MLYPQFSNEIVPALPDSPEPQQDPAADESSQDERQETITEFGQLDIPRVRSDIHVITIVGQVEGHVIMPSQNKTTKYEHIIPQLVAVEQSPDIRALIVILNTVGGDVEAGLAIAEMISSMSKPTVSLVLGGGHSIGVPIAVATDRSFIAGTATMTIHPIRLTGMVIGVQQSFDYLEKMQERIIRFVTDHSHIREAEFKHLMMATGELAHDVGTVVVGKEAVDCGLIDEVGGLGEALAYLKACMGEMPAQPMRKPHQPTNGDIPSAKPPLQVKISPYTPHVHFRPKG